MIARLRGVVLEASGDRAVLDVGGVGYEVLMAPSSLARLPCEGAEAQVHIIESVALYGGALTLYGFLSAEEKTLFECLKENVPNTGAKKALEILDRASRSLPEFRRAVAHRDAKALSEGFGFTKKTAERLVEALKDKLPFDGALPAEAALPRPAVFSGTLGQAQQALGSLGYRAHEAKAALETVQAELAGRQASVEEIIRLALKKL